MSEDKFYTVEQAAERLQVHDNTIYRWIRLGLLRAHKLGQREYRIAEADLMAMYQPVSEPQAIEA
jgi:excisionase family DNA binding protein